MEKTTIILNNKSITEAIGKRNSGHCRPIGNDKGEVFTSIMDAAESADVTYAYMWKCLQPGGPSTCKGHAYFYLDKRDESFDAVMKRLAETTAENERRKADEDDARKWREYQAELERKRILEEIRLEEERKAKEAHEKAIAKAVAKIERRREIHARLVQKSNEAMARTMEAEMEYEALTGKAYGAAEENIA